MASVIRKKENLILGIGTLLLLILAFGTLARRHSTDRGPELLGKPTPAADGAVRFELNNRTHRRIRYAVCIPQTKSNGLWPDFVLSGEAMAMGIIPPEGTIWLVVGPPSNDEAWRVPVVWGYEPSKFAVLMARLMRQIKFWRTADGGAWGLVWHTNFSNEFAPPKRTKSL